MPEPAPPKLASAGSWCDLDAADTSAYVDAVPADLVLLVGIFGNISRTDVSTTIATAPQFCAPGATVIWSRGRDRDDINDSIRAEFGDAGFTELGYAESALPSRPALGSMRYRRPASTARHHPASLHVLALS